MTAFTLQEMLYAAPLRVQFTPLDSGVHILLTGGQRSHVGAVGLAQNGVLVDSAVYPTHREAVVAQRWAKELSARLNTSVTVACGIHYDNSTHEQIEAVLERCERLLARTIRTAQGLDHKDEI